MLHFRIRSTLGAALVLCAAIPQAYAAVSGSATQREPDITLLLGCGLIAIGLLYRRKNPR